MLTACKPIEISLVSVMSFFLVVRIFNLITTLIYKLIKMSIQYEEHLSHLLKSALLSVLFIYFYTKFSF